MTNAASREFTYANAEQLVAEIFAKSFLPPERASVADYTAQHRYLSNEGGGYVGRWRHDIAPYLREPMEVLTSRLFTTTAIVGPGQCGKTEVAANWLLTTVATDPADILWYMQTDDTIRSYVKQRINPMIDMHDVMRNRLGLRSVDDSLGFKRFQGMSVQFLVASHSSMISKSAPRIIADEIDAYGRALGDVKALLDVRRQTFGDESMLLAISHPDLATKLSDDGWNAGIMAIYGDSDRRIWWWKCPECGGWSSPNPTASRVMRLDFPLHGTLDEIADATRLICPVNGCVLDESHRRAMNITGRWIGAGQVIDQDGHIIGHLLPRTTAGFWVTGLMSPFIMGGMGGLARAYVKALRERDKTGEEDSLRQVMVKQWGQPYETPRAHGELSAETLAARAEPELALGLVANGVRFITAAADVQNNRFELLFRGWGEHGESWVIQRQVIKADTAVSPADWDVMVSALLDTRFPLADGSGRTMGVRAAGYDSGGAPGVTQQAYDAWRRWRLKRRVVRYGMVDGRDAWNLLPTKGSGTPTAPRLSVVYPDNERKDRMVHARGTVPIAQFSANQFKDDLGGQLANTVAGPWSVHFPAGLLEPVGSPQIFFEQLVAERRKLNGTWEKLTAGAKNEALDLMVMTHVLAHLMGLSRINWASPQSWAAPWDNNSMVKAPEAPSPSQPLQPLSEPAQRPVLATAYTPPKRDDDPPPPVKPSKVSKLA